VTILNMANILKLNIVAEGVETSEQLDFLINHDCHIFQGYLYSNPLPIEQFAAYYRNRE
jgi:sensor c-di-GMP phosphodiesterase-like protein